MSQYRYASSNHFGVSFVVHFCVVTKTHCEVVLWALLIPRHVPRNIHPGSTACGLPFSADFCRTSARGGGGSSCWSASARHCSASQRMARRPCGRGRGGGSS